MKALHKTDNYSEQTEFFRVLLWDFLEERESRYILQLGLDLDDLDIYTSDSEDYYSDEAESIFLFQWNGVCVSRWCLHLLTDMYPVYESVDFCWFLCLLIKILFFFPTPFFSEKKFRSVLSTLKRPNNLDVYPSLISVVQLRLKLVMKLFA